MVRSTLRERKNRRSAVQKIHRDIEHFWAVIGASGMHACSCPYTTNSNFHCFQIFAKWTSWITNLKSGGKSTHRDSQFNDKFMSVRALQPENVSKQTFDTTKKWFYHHVTVFDENFTKLTGKMSPSILPSAPWQFASLNGAKHSPCSKKLTLAGFKNCVGNFVLVDRP